MVVVGFFGSKRYPAHSQDGMKSALGEAGFGVGAQGGGSCVLILGSRRAQGRLWECSSDLVGTWRQECAR